MVEDTVSPMEPIIENPIEMEIEEGEYVIGEGISDTSLLCSEEGSGWSRNASITPPMDLSESVSAGFMHFPLHHFGDYNEFIWTAGSGE